MWGVQSGDGRWLTPNHPVQPGPHGWNDLATATWTWGAVPVYPFATRELAAGMASSAENGITGVATAGVQVRREPPKVAMP